MLWRRIGSTETTRGSGTSPPTRKQSTCGNFCSGVRIFGASYHAGTRICCAPRFSKERLMLPAGPGRRVFEGAWAGVLVPFILAANGHCCNWRHLALPVACLLPDKAQQQEEPAYRDCTGTPAGKFILRHAGAKMNLEPLTANAVDPRPSESSVSIIIPTRNRCATLALCLNALPAGTREVPVSRSDCRRRLLFR